MIPVATAQAARLASEQIVALVAACAWRLHQRYPHVWPTSIAALDMILDGYPIESRIRFLDAVAELPTNGEESD